MDPLLEKNIFNLKKRVGKEKGLAPSPLKKKTTFSLFLTSHTPFLFLYIFCPTRGGVPPHCVCWKRAQGAFVESVVCHLVPIPPPPPLLPPTNVLTFITSHAPIIHYKLEKRSPPLWPTHLPSRGFRRLAIVAANTHTRLLSSRYLFLLYRCSCWTRSSSFDQYWGDAHIPRRLFRFTHWNLQVHNNINSFSAYLFLKQQEKNVSLRGY